VRSILGLRSSKAGKAAAAAASHRLSRPSSSSSSSSSCLAPTTLTSRVAGTHDTANDTAAQRRLYEASNAVRRMRAGGGKGGAWEDRGLGRGRGEVSEDVAASIAAGIATSHS